MKGINTLKIWAETEIPHQTLGFEMPELPGETFRLVVPELISDTEEALLPWGHPSPKWNIDQESARCSIEVSGTLRMAAQVLFQPEKIDVVVTVCNLSDRTWEQANLFTCFAYFKAPLFDDTDLTRTYFPVGPGTWKPVGDMYAEHSPGDGPYTFFAVRGGPTLSDLWVCRQIKQNHTQEVSRGAACVVSSCGQWVAGMTSSNPAYVFNNRSDCCIHADPLLGTIKPGETTQALSTVHIFRGSVEDFDARISG